MNSITAIIYVSLFCNFSAYCMELTTSNTNHVTDIALQKLITQVNKSSLHIVNIIKEQARHNNIELIPHNIGSFLQLDQKTIDDFFLNHVEDDNLRPLLLSMGANIKALTKEDRNCLWGIKKPELVTELIAQGAEVDVIDKNDLTPITYLMHFYLDSPKDIEIARILFTKSSNPKIHLNRAQCALYSIIDTFKKQPSLYLNAAQLLCEYGIDLNDESKFYGTFLMKVIKEGRCELVELFLQHKAEINKPNFYQEYPLHTAMEKAEFYYHSHTREIVPKIVILLLQYGADPNIPYMDGTTMPLHVAVDRNQPDIIKELIKHNAKKHHRNRNGETAYNIAKKRDYKQDILDLLYVEIPEIEENSTHDENKNVNQPLQTIDNNNCFIQ